MKTPIHLGAVVAALALLAGCNSNSGSGEAGDGQAPAASGGPSPQAEPSPAETGQEAPVSGGQGAASPAAVGPAEQTKAPPAQAAVEPPAAFMQCRACHSTEPGAKGYGPSLAGVVGRPAASLPGYGYSAALRASGIVWSRDKLDEWLSGPTRMVPGTRMVLPVGNADQRKAIIDYLETLK